VQLPTYTLFDEGRYFAAGERVRAADLPPARVGILVCEDMWHPALAWLLALDGSDLLLVPSSGPARGVAADGGEGLASQRDWRLLGETAARFHGQYVVYVNRTGSEDGYTYAGGSFVCGPDGRMLAALPELEDAGETVEIDMREPARMRSVSPLRRDARPGLVARELERMRRADGTPAVDGVPVAPQKN
jgi:predicted amidohydrolase